MLATYDVEFAAHKCKGGVGDGVGQLGQFVVYYDFAVFINHLRDFVEVPFFITAPCNDDAFGCGGVGGVAYFVGQFAQPLALELFCIAALVEVGALRGDNAYLVAKDFGASLLGRLCVGLGLGKVGTPCINDGLGCFFF